MQAHGGDRFSGAAIIFNLDSGSLKRGVVVDRGVGVKKWRHSNGLMGL